MDLASERARLVAVCRAAARAQREAGSGATDAHEAAVVDALAALHAFDQRHPELIDFSDRPLREDGGEGLGAPV